MATDRFGAFLPGVPDAVARALEELRRRIGLTEAAIVTNTADIATNTADIAALIDTGTYTPTLSGIVLGTGGTNTASYTVAGGLLMAEGRITLGTPGASVASPSTIALPSGYQFRSNNGQPVGMARYVDPGAAGYPGYLRTASTTTAQFFAWPSAGAHATDDNVSSIVPHTWGSSDRFEWSLAVQVVPV